ncbi:MAG: DUF6785 family protein [Armatimonadota bacterium]
MSEAPFRPEIAGLGEVADPSLARGISWRIIIIAFVVAPLNAYFMAYLQGPRGVEDPTVVALFWNVVFLLFVFRLINAVLLKYFPRIAFSPAELIAFFILLSLSTAPAGLDTMKTSFATMQGPGVFASEVNHWEDLFFKQLPTQMLVMDKPALDRLWQGGSSIFEARNYVPWAGPIFHWWLLFTIMWSAPAGLAVLLRKRWVEQERMSFPIVQLPMEMAQPTLPAFRHPAFWIAAGVVVVINVLNGFHEFYPALPVAAVKINQSQTFNLSKFFIGRPWNAVGSFWMCSYPWVIGLGLLLPTELSLSLWFFYLFWKMEAIAVAWMGLTSIREFPYMKEQSFGGYLAILGFSLWAGRRTFEGVWRRIVTETVGGQRRPTPSPSLQGGGPETAGAVRARALQSEVSHDEFGEDDRAEALSYRNSFFLFAIMALAMVGFGMYIKMSLPVALGFVLQYYAMTIIVGRIRAEMGLPTHELERLGPVVMQGNVFGPRILGLQNLASLSTWFGFTRGMRNIPFPFQLEGLYLAKLAKADMRRLLLAGMVMVPVAVFLSYFFTLYLGYRHGLGVDWAKWMPGSSQESWNQLTNWITRDEGFNWGRIGASIVGYVVYFGLMVTRTRFIGWPLHPAGFALSTTWYMAHMWFPMLLAWTIKSVSMRYAGYKSMRAIRAMAFGLILADIVTGTVWMLYGLFTQTTTYSFWP